MSTVKKGFMGYRVVVFAILALFFNAGCLSAMSVAMASIVGAHPEISLPEISLVYTFGGIGGILGGLVGPVVVKKLGNKKSMMVGAVALVVAMLMYGWIPNVYAIWVAGFIGAFAGVLSGVSVVSGLIANWFIEKRSLVLGIALGCGVFGSAFVQWMGGMIISSAGYPLFFTVLAALIAIFGIVLFGMGAKDDPAQVDQKPLGWDTVGKVEESAGSKKKTVVVEGVTRNQALKSPSFYLLFIGVIGIGMAFMGFKSYGAVLFQSFGIDVATAATYVSIISLFGGFAVMAGGVVADKLGNKAYLYTMCGGLIAALLIISFFGEALASMPALIIVAMLLAGLASPISGALTSTVTTEAFGIKAYSEIVVLFMAAVNASVMLFGIPLSAMMAAGFSLVDCYMFFFLPSAVIGFVCVLVGLVTGPAARMARKMEAAGSDAGAAPAQQ